MTTTTPSPYNTARSLKASPRPIGSPAPTPTPAQSGLKHVTSKSGGDGPHAPHIPNVRQLPRPSSTGGASIASSRSNASVLSSRMKTSPYAVPLTSRSNADKPKVTPRPDSAVSARGTPRVHGNADSISHKSPPHAPPSPLNVSHESGSAGPTHTRLSEPSIDALLLREGLDPSSMVVPSPHTGKTDCDEHRQGDVSHEDIVDDEVHGSNSDPPEKSNTVEPNPTPTDQPCTVYSQDACHDSDHLGESLNKALEQMPTSTDQSLGSPDPSPIPVVENLNLSQYSCAFADTIKGYCSDISSDCSRQEAFMAAESTQQASSVDARCSIDVQVTSRLHEMSQAPIDPLSLETGTNEAKHGKNFLAKILCCGCMQQK